MKNRLFFCGLLLSFLLEAAVLTLLLYPDTDRAQDAVALNEAVHTVQNDWGALDEHDNHTALDYVVVGLDGAVLYRTRQGLSESLNAAVSHKDTIADLAVDGAVVGKLLVYNDDAQIFEAKKRTVLAAVIAAVLVQCGICAAHVWYINRTMVKPFHKLQAFAQRIADGNLDIPLEMDRNNVFGAFTESFDLMRSELKKARIAQARANESKKELVAKLSHDIKTPVASIQAAAEVGAALAQEEKSRNHFAQIIQKSCQINTLVANLFSAALEDLQELSVTPAELSGKELGKLLANADYLHRAKLPPVPECVLFADKLRLQQVFDNLFANSYKYADTAMKVTILRREQELEVCIEDYGGGVSDAELPLLKEKFMRGSNAGSIEGAGLGLYIADSCMKKMQGRLEITNGAHGLAASVRIALKI